MRRRKILTMLFLLFLAVSAVGLIVFINRKHSSQKGQPEENPIEIRYSDHILFSINNGAAGFGTVAECTDAEIRIYTDATVHVFMNTDTRPEICVLNLSDADYKQLAELALPDKISSLQVEEDLQVCDGSSSYIKLYDENDKAVVYKGGYMPVGQEFREIYSAIKEILKPYGIEERVAQYRDSMTD